MPKVVKLDDKRPRYGRGALRPGPGLYILEGRKPVVVRSLLRWAQAYEKSEDRIVASTEVGNYTVSTIFLGLDFNFTSEGPPILFETVVFDEDGNCVSQLRYDTWEHAEI